MGSRCDLAIVVDEALARVRRRARDVTFEVALSPWWVNGDAPALSRAVTNLLDNAVKWSPRRGDGDRPASRRSPERR